MSDRLEYRGYTTTIKYNTADKLLHGKIEGIDDLIMFESDSVNDIEEAFHRAVDSYILNIDDDNEFNTIDAVLDYKILVEGADTADIIKSKLTCYCLDELIRLRDEYESDKKKLIEYYKRNLEQLGVD